MPRRHILKTIETFASLQGEGARQGEPAVFVRLAGCNLRCPFCDTKYALKGGREETVEDILVRIASLRLSLPAAWVVVTGGEPLLQDITPLVKGLHGLGLRVQVETNGTLEPRPPADWYSLSPKPPAYSYHLLFLKKASEIKLVVSRDLTIEVIEKIRKTFPTRVPIFLQVQDNARWSMKKAIALARRACREELENVRVSVQLHKILGLR